MIAVCSNYLGHMHCKSGRLRRFSRGDSIPWSSEGRLPTTASLVSSSHLYLYSSPRLSKSSPASPTASRVVDLDNDEAARAPGTNAGVAPLRQVSLIEDVSREMHDVGDLGQGTRRRVSLARCCCCCSLALHLLPRLVVPKLNTQLAQPYEQRPLLASRIAEPGAHEAQLPAQSAALLGCCNVRQLLLQGRVLPDEVRCAQGLCLWYCFMILTTLILLDGHEEVSHQHPRLATPSPVKLGSPTCSCMALKPSLDIPPWTWHRNLPRR